MHQDRHRLALRAALLDDEAGEEAFESWRRLVPLDAADHDEFRILPLIYLRAAERGCTAPEMGRLKGVYRQVWVRNNLLLQTCADAVGMLAGAGIDSVLLKGVAMIARWSDSIGARAMRDVDILVPRAEARRASLVLARAGWTAKSLQIDDFTEADLDWWPGAALTRQDGGEIDLHWRALPRNTAPSHDAMFWSAAQPVRIKGVDARVLSAEDHLYHTLLHGSRWTDGAELDWMVDACALIRSQPGGILWDRIVEHAERDRSVPAMARQFAMLEEVLGVTTPISAALARSRTSPLDQHSFETYRRPGYFPRQGEITLVNYHAALVRTGGRLGPTSWLAFVQEQWGLARAADLLPEGLFRLLGRPAAARGILARSGLSMPPDKVDPPGLDMMSAGAVGGSPFLFGWSVPEADGRWTSGHDAVLGFRDDTDQASGLPVTLWARPYLAGRHRSLRVDVIVNGVPCGAWRFRGGEVTQRVLRFTIPQAVRRRRAGRLQIALAIRNPARPEEVDGSRDNRRLGLFLEKVRFGHPRADADTAGRIDFRQGANSDLLLDGWSGPEADGRWTDGECAAVALALPERAPGTIAVTLEGRLFPGAAADQSLEIRAEGCAIASRIEPAGPGAEIVLRFSAEPAPIGQSLGLRFDLIVGRPTSPSSLGASDDDRRLGFQLRHMTLDTAARGDVTAGTSADRGPAASAPPPFGRG